MDCMKYNDHKPLDTAAQRIYMQLVKKYGWEPACAGKFAIRHLNREVKSVFDITGFSKILNIEE